MTFHLSFQSRVGPVQWLRPYTDDMIKVMGDKEQVRVCSDACCVQRTFSVLYVMCGVQRMI